MSQDNQATDKITTDMAWSVLFESMAQIFSYPQQTFYQAIGNGQLMDLFQNCLLIIHAEQSLMTEVDTISDTLAAQCQRHAFTSLEADYIALFEVNKELAPIHPNAHLYEPKQYDQLSLYQHLNRFYRANGLEIQPDQQADHLCVQLNFMAWLYRQADSSADKNSLHGVLKEFHSQLLWIHPFAQQLEARQHWLYSAMSRLLLSFI